MTISFLLNGKQESLDLPANKRLVDILRENFSLLRCRAGCYSGECGTCVVFVNGELAHACLVNAISAQDSDVVTCEGIEENDVYADILAGFEQAGYRPCDNCFQSKVLSVFSLFSSSPVPDEADIGRILGWHQCTCTDSQGLFSAINAIVNQRRSRHHGGR